MGSDEIPEIHRYGCKETDLEVIIIFSPFAEVKEIDQKKCSDVPILHFLLKYCPSLLLTFQNSTETTRRHKDIYPGINLAAQTRNKTHL